MKRMWMFSIYLVGCATSSASGPGQTFDLRAASGDSFTAVCGDQGCTGPEIQVQKSPGGFMGTLGTRAVDLKVGVGDVDGAVGSEPVHLTVSEQNGALRMAGMFAGQLGDLTLGKDELQGKVGGCSYDLKASGDAYSGNRACRAGPSAATVKIPASITSRPPAERAALLALLLAQ